MKWKIKKTTEKYSRINKFSDNFFEFIYENDFEMAKILIDDGKVDVNIKYDCRDTPLIAVCQQTPLQSEEEAVKLFIIYGRAVLNSTPQINQGRQPCILQRAMTWRRLQKI